MMTKQRMLRLTNNMEEYLINRDKKFDFGKIGDIQDSADEVNFSSLLGYIVELLCADNYNRDFFKKIIGLTDEEILEIGLFFDDDMAIMERTDEGTEE